MEKKFICTKPHSGSRPAEVWWAHIDDRGWVDGETPIEDFGMFMILDVEISSESADRLFLALLAQQEGQPPEVKKEVTHEDQLFRSVYAPPLLTEEEFEIFQSLITKNF